MVISLTLLTLMAQPSLQAQLSAVAQKKVFFAHQSVGGNVLQGVSSLAAEAKVPLRIAEVPAPTGTPGLEHALVGTNTDPSSKLQGFEQLLGKGTAPQLAVVKLCYVDISADTDAAALFAQYQAMVKTLEAKYPNVGLVHVTAPLTTVQAGFKGFLKDTFGKGAAGTRENIKRHTYNELVRKAYGQGRLFDLAAVEAGEGGGACRFTKDGASYPCLRPALSDDGGHLNAKGQAEAARALISVLAKD